MDKVLKQRLIGASILIALAVIFIPMLLVDPDAVEAPSSESFEVLEMPEGGGEVRRIPLDPTAARQPEPATRAEPRSQPPETRGPEESAAEEPPADRIVLRPELRESAGDRAPAEVDAPDAATEPAADSPVAESPVDESPTPARPAPNGSSGASDKSGSEIGEWIVQVASFGSEVSANEVRARLETLGHIVHRDELVRGDSLLYRLRTGPYVTRAAAEQARAQIRATVTGVEPIVRQVGENSSGAAGEPGFAVQVGSFAGEDNAERETARLAGLGFDAFRVSERIGERVIWRVLVGPVPDRAAAEVLQARVLDQAGVEGLVVSRP